MALALAAIACAEHTPTTRPLPARTSSDQTPSPATSDANASIGLQTPMPPAPSAAANAVAEPAYDLAADRAARTELAKTDLGPQTVVELVDPIFVVAGGGVHNRASLQSPIALSHNALAAYMNGRFTKSPTRAIAIYLFPDITSYHAYCQRHYQAPCISRFGFYEPSERKMVMNGAGGTLTHELVHPMVEADFPSAPTWLNEGIASLFEQPYIPKAGEIHGGKNWRLPRLLAVLGSVEQGLEARPSAIIGMSDEVFRGDREDLHYAAARYLCQWLDSRDQLWPFYHLYRDQFATDPTREKAFTTVTGLTPDAANAPWTRWVRAL